MEPISPTSIDTSLDPLKGSPLDKYTQTDVTAHSTHASDGTLDLLSLGFALAEVFYSSLLVFISGLSRLFARIVFAFHKYISLPLFLSEWIVRAWNRVAIPASLHNLLDQASSLVKSFEKDLFKFSLHGPDA